MSIAYPWPELGGNPANLLVMNSLRMRYGILSGPPEPNLGWSPSVATTRVLSSQGRRVGTANSGQMKLPSDWIVRRWALGIIALALPLLGQSPESIQRNPPTTNQVPAERVILPAEIPDPIEPFNRAMWSFNKGLILDVINPTAQAYRFVVVKPVRRGISNVNRNLLFPARVFNNLLQARWTGARDESYRFLVNSTVGVGGIFDLATRWNIPKSDADFGQTFGQWGWKPGCFIMLPIFGPSSERDTLGLAADTAANPLLYVSPYRFEHHNVFTYLGVYSDFNLLATYNGLSDSVPEAARFSESETDPYEEIRLAWTFARDSRKPDFDLHGPRDKTSLETLKAAFVTYKDPEFPVRAKTRSVVIPSTGRKLPFSYWLQRGKAPLVYVLPGLGGHRLAQPALALAESLYGEGFSVVCISNPFNSEFMERASSADLPAYLPIDAKDVHVALNEIDRRLTDLYPGRLGKKALLGYSMGALDALYIAAAQSTNTPSLIQFDRVVAISTPVRLMHGVEKLDNFYQAPLEWAANERSTKLENTFLKVAALVKNGLPTNAPPPFEAVESKFLIGMSFRFILRDVVFSSQRRVSQHVLREPISKFNREKVYEEISRYSYQDYLHDFAAPYYEKTGLVHAAADALTTAGDLRTYEAGLRANPKIRIILNENDFLLDESDLAWLRSTFPGEQLTVFPDGGHLGNLAEPAMQKAIVGALAGLGGLKGQ